MTARRIIPFVLICSLSAAVIACRKEAEKKTAKTEGDRTLGIVLAQNSALRVDPYIFSALVIKLNKGDTIEVVDKSSEKTWIAGQQDFWYKARLSNSITGWIFGKNIRILSSKNEGDVAKYVKEFFKDETETLRKEISGRWWSINRFEDFTDDALEFTTDGKYKSYKNQQNPKILQGEYTVDFQNSEIVFSEGTSFGENLKFAPRGRTYVLYKEIKGGELLFKKISTETALKHDAQKEKEDSKNGDPKKGDPKVKKEEPAPKKDENTAQ